MYMPKLARFTARDPLPENGAVITGLLGGMPQYAYVHNNPVNSVDPSGLDDVTVLPKPITPQFPKPGGMSGPKENGKTLFGFNICCRLKRKEGSPFTDSRGDKDK